MSLSYVPDISSQSSRGASTVWALARVRTEDGAHLLGSRCREQCLARLGVAQNARDVRQRVQVFLKLIVRYHEQQDDSDGLLIQRIELDVVARDAEYRFDAIDVIARRVRNA